jgi:tape measure domain-containing protein
MASSNEEIKIIIKAAADQAINDINKLNAGLAGTSKSSDDASKKATGLGSAFGAIAKLGIAAMFIDLAKSAAMNAGEIEKNTVAFTVLLGSGEKAQKMMSDLKQFGLETPFELPGIVEASKKLLGFGISAESMIPTLRRLGDAAMGNQEVFERISDAYGKSATKGKVTFEELNRFLEAGVPILGQLAQNYGVTTGQMSKMIEDGKVGFSALDKALTSLTTGNGQFAGMMEKQSHTFLGIMSNAKDAIGALLAAMGEQMLPGLKVLGEAFIGASKDGGSLMKMMTKMGEGLGFLASGFAGFFALISEGNNMLKSLMMADQVNQSAEATNEATKQLKDYVTATTGAQQGTKQFADAMKELKNNGDATFKELYDSAMKSGKGMQDNVDKMNEFANQTKKIQAVSESLKQFEADYTTTAIQESQVRTQAKLQDATTAADGQKAIMQGLKDIQKEDYDAAVATENNAYAQKMQFALTHTEWLKQNNITVEMIKAQHEEKLLKLADDRRKKEQSAETALQKNLTTLVQDNLKIRTQQFMEWTSFMLSNLDQSNKEQFALYKGFAIVMATIDTYKAANAAFSSLAGIPYVGYVLGLAAAASCVALGLANVSKIASSSPRKAATGALVKGSQQGSTLTVGENNRSELIVPFENPEVMGKMTGGGGVNLYITNLYATEDLPKKLVQEIDKELYKLKQDRGSVFASSMGF